MTFAFSDEQLAAMFEEMANKEGFNLRVEIERLRVQPQVATGAPELALSSTSRVAKAPAAALPSHVLRRREALEKGMAVAYAHYAAESRVRGSVVKIGPPPVDIRKFLPEGYDPHADLPPPRAVRPGRRGDAAKKNTKAQAQAPAQSQSRPKPPEGPRKSGTSGRRSIANQNLGASSADVDDAEAQLEADVSAALDEPRSDGLNAESIGMFGDAVLPKLRRAELYVTLQPAARYMEVLRERYLRLRSIYLRAVGRLQRFYRTRVVLVVLLRYWMGRTWPISFILNIRIRRKRRAAQLLVKAMYENLSNSRLAILRKYTRRVEKCKRYMRGYLAIVHARRDAVRRLWERAEQALRKRIAIRDRKLAAKLKLEQRERLLASAALGPRSAGSIHAKWLSKQAEVGTILARSELVQSAYRSSAATTNRVLVAHGMGEVGGGADDNESLDPTAVATGVAAAAAADTAIDFDSVDPVERDKIIGGIIADKRRRHIAAIAQDSAERSRARGQVDLKDVQTYVKARGAAHQGSLLHIGTKMTEGLHRLNAQSSWIANSGLPRARNGFRMLTDSDLGQSWAKIINDAVLADMAAKKALYCA